MEEHTLRHPFYCQKAQRGHASGYLATISIDGVVAFCIVKLNVSRCLYIE
jgi:hypothetical protein